MDLRIKTGIGIVMIVLGVVAYGLSLNMLQGCEGLAGTVGQAASEEMQERCQLGNMLRPAGIVTVALGFLLIFADYFGIERK